MFFGAGKGEERGQGKRSECRSQRSGGAEQPFGESREQRSGKTEQPEQPFNAKGANETQTTQAGEERGL